jgi:hypothetical protein
VDVHLSAREAAQFQGAAVEVSLYRVDPCDPSKAELAYGPVRADVYDSNHWVATDPSGFSSYADMGVGGLARVRDRHSAGLKLH